MMQTNPKQNTLFLRDVSVDLMETVSVPVIPGWDWHISGTGTGYLSGPDQLEYCHFDLLNSKMSFEPGTESFTAPGLSASVVQDIGEKYVYEQQFTDAEKAVYNTHVQVRDDMQKARNREVRKTLTGVIQLEHKEGRWLAHVDTERVKELTGIESSHVLSVQQGYDLFNRMSEALHAQPLRDSSGYMTLDGNVYDFIHQEYLNRYEDAQQAIDNQILDGSGYGVDAVLNKLQQTVRKDIRQCMPYRENYSDLRFVELTDDRKKAVENFVKCRLSLTLTYEKKRSYEQSAIDKTNQLFSEAKERLRESLSGMGPIRMDAQAMEA